MLYIILELRLVVTVVPVTHKISYRYEICGKYFEREYKPLKHKKEEITFMYTFILCFSMNLISQLDACVSLQFFHSYNFLVSHQMDIKLPPHLTSFILAIRRYLSQQRLSLDDFLSQFNLSNPSRMSQKDITRIVQRINQSGESIKPSVIFITLSKGTNFVLRETFLGCFYKVFRIDHMQLQGEPIPAINKMDKTEESLLEAKANKLGSLGFGLLCRHMQKKQQKLNKIFNDCDLDKSGGIDKEQFNKFLVASGIAQFRDKDLRRYLIRHVFKNRKKQKMARQDFFKMFQSGMGPKESVSGYSTGKGYKKGTLKAISTENSIHDQMKKVHATHQRKTLFNNPESEVLFKQQANLNDVPKFKMNPNLQNNLRAYPNAGRYYRLGNPSVEDQPYLQELQRLLSSKRTFQDSKNPVAEGQYTDSSTIFGGQEYALFLMSPEEMNSDRRNLRINQFIEADDIMQGAVGDCYFLSGIGSLAAEYPELVSEKFLFQVNPANYYAVKFFVDGEWIIYKTDDMFPCDQDQVLYAKPNNCEIWALLLEKAFAKIFGSYQAIDGGYSTEAFFALTGAPNVYINLQNQSDIEGLKAKILQAEKNGFIMATSGSEQLSKLSKEERQKMGLISGHAYSLLFVKEINGEVFVKLRNPWGHYVWKGDWSFTSPLWTPELRKRFEYEQQVQDGTFYMIWKDYYQHFGDITICKINPTNIHSSFRMINNKRKSNYIRLNVTTSGTYDVFICQESRRKYAGQDYKFANARLIIMREVKEGRYQFVAAKSMYRDQLCNIEVELSPGSYVISAKVIWDTWTDHQCFLTAYGPEKVGFEKMNRGIASQFKEDLFTTFAAANLKNADIGSYEDSGFKNLVTETYFSMDEGIGYIKTSNKTNKTFKINLKYTLTGLKIAKPKTNPYILQLKPGRQDILGFMVSLQGYEYSYGYSLTAK